MISANELRIGNWVKHFSLEEKDSGEIKIHKFIKVSGIGVQPDKSQIKQYYSFVVLDGKEHFGIDVSAIDPIPLTSEILEKIDWNGYIKFHINSYFSIDDVGHLYYHNDYTGINIEYLHQLQNLYFALTGEELNIQL